MLNMLYLHPAVITDFLKLLEFDRIIIPAIPKCNQQNQPPAIMVSGFLFLVRNKGEYLCGTTFEEQKKIWQKGLITKLN